MAPPSGSAHAAPLRPTAYPPLRRSRQRAEFEIPAQRSSVHVARQLLVEWLRRWRCPQNTVDTAQLIMSEFVTNAVIHTVSDRVDCRLQRCERWLRIEVRDQGTGVLGLVPRSENVEATNGRGLQLVDALADVWGDIPAAPAQGRIVWAELRLGNA